MSALRRLIIRHGKFSADRPRHRGVRGQLNRHIIGRGIRNCHTFVRLGKTINLARGRMIPMELHATKGWRYVPAWS